MALVITDDKHYKNTANAFRKWIGTTKQYKPEEMASGVDSVYEAGQKSEYDRFWNAYQESGNKTNYRYAFAGKNWTDEIYNPKYDIVAEYTNGSDAESNNMFTYTEITDTKVPIILRSSSATAQYTGLFYYAANLVTVPMLKFEGNFAHNTNCFQGAKNLENITFGGSITQSGMNLSYCNKLTVDSMLSLFDCLVDYSGSGSTYSLTLGTTNLNKLTNEQKAIATQKGWTLA